MVALAMAKKKTDATQERKEGTRHVGPRGTEYNAAQFRETGEYLVKLGGEFVSRAQQMDDAKVDAVEIKAFKQLSRGLEEIEKFLASMGVAVMAATRKSS